MFCLQCNYNGCSTHKNKVSPDANFCLTGHLTFNTYTKSEYTELLNGFKSALTVQ
uniref:Uncharacterized protein n=1 Tax=Anguilla anguilla TaxID=7936 RepID=A0A0E9P617_ANGAN